MLAKRAGLWIKVAQRQDPYGPVDACSVKRSTTLRGGGRGDSGMRLTRRVHQRSVPPCERGEQRAAPFELLLLPRVT